MRLSLTRGNSPKARFSKENKVLTKNVDLDSWGEFKPGLSDQEIEDFPPKFSLRLKKKLWG